MSESYEGIDAAVLGPAFRLLRTSLRIRPYDITSKLRFEASDLKGFEEGWGELLLEQVLELKNIVKCSSLQEIVDKAQKLPKKSEKIRPLSGEGIRKAQIAAEQSHVASLLAANPIYKEVAGYIERAGEEYTAEVRNAAIELLAKFFTSKKNISASDFAAEVAKMQKQRSSSRLSGYKTLTDTDKLYEMGLTRAAELMSESQRSPGL